MANIQVLDQTTIDKIAAGEVVEKPYSVVKELVENAIDAKATAITVEIKDGGISFIRITDNGCGIPKEEIRLAFLRHSTSKIRKVEDLQTIASLGFRGEALSSISAVAQVELITKTSDSFIGTRYVIEGGVEKQFDEIGAPDGTTFIIRNLFYNTPARKKFLKTATTEGTYIQDLVERLALSHPEVSFKLIVNNQMKLHTSGNTNLKDIIYQIYGRDIASNLIEVSYESEQVTLKGFIGKPVISRGNRQYENYFVNGRYVKSSIISKGIEQAYKNYMMQHKYPFTVLLAQFDGQALDVNVHPTKMELRFSDGEMVYRLFYHVISQALAQKELITDVTIGNEKKVSSAKVVTKTTAPEPFEKQRIREVQEKQQETVKLQEAVKPQQPLLQKPIVTEKGKEEALQKVIEPEPVKVETIQKNEELGIKPVEQMQTISDTEVVKQEVIRETSVYTVRHKEPEVKQPIKETEVPVITKSEQLSFFEKELIEKKIEDEIKIIGQVFDTYWILQYGEKMYIIDQHAAHEKVLYERIMKQLAQKEFTSQMLSPPLILTVSAVEAEILKEYKSSFEKLGFEMEPFGGKEYAIYAVPGNLYGLNEKDLFLEMLDDFSSQAGKINPDMILDKLASMSCKAAVKGNQKLSEAEARELLIELMQLENPYHCPHGRPVIVAMTKQELEKKFKRIV